MRLKGEARENKGHEWFGDLQSGEEGGGGRCSDLHGSDR